MPATHAQIEAAVVAAKAAATRFSGINISAFVSDENLKSLVGEIVNAALETPAMDNPNQPLAPK